MLLALLVACDAQGVDVETPDSGCTDAAVCGECVPMLSWSGTTADTAHLPVHADPPTGDDVAWKRLRMRPFTVALPDGAPAGLVEIDAGGLAVYDEDGDPQELPGTLAEGTWLADAGAPGSYALAARFRGEVPCDGEATITAVAGIDPGLTGRPRASSPGWESADVFFDTERPAFGLDLDRWTDRRGATGTLHVVPHRTPEAWVADSTLAGATFTADVDLDADGFATLATWDDPSAQGDASADYDVVVDLDGDGALSPGDLVDGLAESPGLSVVGDLTADGPHEVEQVDWGGGEWLGERIYWPTDLAAVAPAPLVVISHGNGHDYRWYDYLGHHLASWGYVVMAHENNTQPGIETASTTTLTNTDYLLGHTDVIADGALDGLVDAHRIVWIGHSRGGEGVVRAYDRVVDGAWTPELYAAEDVVGVGAIAPTVYNSVNDSDPHEVPFFLLAGTADGDVTGGVDCTTCDFFRIAAAARGPMQAAYVHGASHNDFNCCGFDDGVGPALIGPDEAQRIARAYFLAFVRHYADGDPGPLDLFRRLYGGFHPATFDDDDVIAGVYRDSHAFGYPVLDDHQAGVDPTTSSSGGVVETDADEVYEGGKADQDAKIKYASSDEMNGVTWATGPSDDDWAVTFSWADGAAPTYTVSVEPELADWTGYRVVSLAMGQLPRHPQTDALGGDLTFSLTLLDTQGVEATTSIADLGAVPALYARTGGGAGEGWAAEIVTVRLPLADLTIGTALDLQHVAAVRLSFGGTLGSASGAVVLDNLELSR